MRLSKGAWVSLALSATAMPSADAWLASSLPSVLVPVSGLTRNITPIPHNRRATSTSSTRSSRTTSRMTSRSISRSISRRTSSLVLQLSTSNGVPDTDLYESVLDDGKGHISSDLARSIWNWDHENRAQHPEQAHNMPKFKYSTRKGLKIVDQVARDLLDTLETKSFSSTASSEHGTMEDSSAMSYSDLVQEGVVALMYAMANFDPEQAHQSDSESSFETYATKEIFNNMSRCLADNSRPIRLPSHVQSALQKAKKEKILMESELGREVSIAEIADKVGVPADKLELYHLVSRGTLSMESTIEVYDPWLDNDSAPFRDETDWEKQNQAFKEQPDLGEDPLYEDEGEDEMWVQEQQIAGPLGGFIPDTSASPDDVALASMIQHDVDDFLVRTLDPKELEIVRMRYGLHDGSGTGMSLAQVAKQLAVSKTRVAQIEERALDKLRTSYTNRYVETYLDDEHEWITDTV